MVFNAILIDVYKNLITRYNKNTKERVDVRRVWDHGLNETRG